MQTEIKRENGNRIINIKFANLTDLYDYLKSNPVINRRIFSSPASLSADDHFHGVSLEKSIEYCLGGYKKDFDNFLEVNEQLKKIGLANPNNKRVSRSLYGGAALAPLVAAEIPQCMVKYKRENDLKFITLYFNLSYNCGTSESEIVNRGLATLYIIKTLESRGYVVNLKAFELSTCGDEVLNIDIGLKRPGDLILDIEKCYFPIKAKEFLRRILFRVVESADVENSWGYGYGCPASVGFTRSFFEAGDKDLVIGEPSSMGIGGNNIYEDTATLIKRLNIQDEFDMQKIKKLARKDY